MNLIMNQHQYIGHRWLEGMARAYVNPGVMLIVWITAKYGTSYRTLNPISMSYERFMPRLARKEREIK